jgi:hypothetical protein
MDERDARNTRQSKGSGESVQLELPDLVADITERRDILANRVSNIAGTDIISKSDLAMMRGRRKRHDRQKRNEW